MQTVNPASSDFGVKMGDHIYPHVDPPHGVFVPHAPEIIDDDSPNQVRKQMADAIEELLPFLSQPKHGNDKTILFGTYVDSVSILERCRGEVQQLFRAMIETVLEVDSAGALPADARSEILAEIMKDAEIQLSRPENLATAEIAAFEPNQIQTCLQASLRKSIGKLVTELMDGLGVLVDRSVAGLQHWPSPNSVKYHFFRRRIAQTGVRVSKKRGRVQRRSEEEAARRFPQVEAASTTHNDDTSDLLAGPPQARNGRCHSYQPGELQGNHAGICAEPGQADPRLDATVDLRCRWVSHSRDDL